MLALGRKPGEYIMIGDQIKVMVVESDSGLRLAIDAPREVPIVRGEVYEQILAEGKQLERPSPQARKAKTIQKKTKVRN